MKQLNDEQLMLLWGRGRGEAFDELYVRFHGRVQGYLRRLLPSEGGELEDLSQEVFLRLARAGGSWRPQAKLSTWLFTVASNCALQHLRRRKRHPQLRVLPGGEGREPVVTSVAADPLQRAEEKEGETLLHGVLAGMSPERRAVFLLRQGEGMSYAEVARSLDLPLGTVKTELHRARTQLARALMRQEPGRQGRLAAREGTRT